MEIMIKTKQSKNVQFEFMNFENPLNLYYQHLVKIIKEGKYRPKQQKEPKKEEGRGWIWIGSLENDLVHLFLPVTARGSGCFWQLPL